MLLHHLLRFIPPRIDHEAINGSQSVRVITAAAKRKQPPPTLTGVCYKAAALYLKSVVFGLVFYIIRNHVCELKQTSG